MPRSVLWVPGGQESIAMKVSKSSSPVVLNLYEKLRGTADKNPDSTAIDALSHAPLSYQRLVEHIEKSVVQLNSFGVGRSDRVAMVISNGPEMATAFLTVSSAATCAPLNPSYRVEDYDFYLSDLNAKALIIEEGLGSPAEKAASMKGIPIIRLSPVLEDCAGIFKLTPLTKKSSTACRGGFTAPEDTALVLHTSGTTARPKMVPLTQQNICTSAYNVAGSLQLTATDRCLNVMPLFHIHGLIGVLLSSLFSGASVVCSPGFQPFSFFEWMKVFRPTWYSAVPTMHQAILEHARDNLEIIDCCPLRFVRSSSSAIPPQVVKELESVFKTPVIEAYGMTEASHQMASNPLPPHRRKPRSVGIAAGPEVKIMNKVGVLLAPEEVGEIVIRGANVTSGYHNNKAANAYAFTEGWFRTGDLGRMDGEGNIFIDGRIKEIINRGGEKISPREIDEALLNHPDIRQAVAFAVKHPSLGEDIAAAVVLRKGAAVSEQKIRDFAFERLADFKVPSQIVIVDTIPTGATGKLQRIGLVDKLAAQLKREFIAPRSELEKMVATAFSEVLDTSPIGLYDNFFASGGDSLRGTQLVSRIRSSLLIDLPITALFRKPTVVELSAEIVRLKDDIETTRLANIMDEIEELSEEEAARLLAQELEPKA